MDISDSLEYSDGSHGRENGIAFKEEDYGGITLYNKNWEENEYEWIWCTEFCDISEMR